MIALVALLLCGDSFHLRYEARRAGLPPARVEAIARVETACNLNPLLRAHDCGVQAAKVPKSNAVGAPPVRGPARDRRECEVGRFQIKPSTARGRCKDENVRAYRGNVACMMKMFAEDAARYGLTDATVRHNGYGPAGAYAFLYKVLKAEEGR